MRKLTLGAAERNALIEWLAGRGSPAPAHEREWLRVRLSTGIGVVLRAKGEAVVLSHACIREIAAADVEPTQSASASKRLSRVRRLIERDGQGCFYCGEALTEDAATLEHLVARCLGGPNILANLVLACQPCNAKAADRTVIEKIRLREAAQAASSGMRPVAAADDQTGNAAEDFSPLRMARRA